MPNRSPESTRRLARLAAAAERLPHGVRAKYVVGCRCQECRRANCEYAKRRERRKAVDGGNPTVPAAAVLDHIAALRASGIGWRSVADAAGVCRTVVYLLISGKKPSVRRATEQKILNVDAGAAADGTLVPAGPTWRILNGLIAEGYTRRQLAVFLGSKAKQPALQVQPHWITAKTAAKVEKMARALDAGRLRRDR